MNAPLPPQNNLLNFEFPLKSRIIFSILDEFGPQFIGKSYFVWLSQSLRKYYAPGDKSDES